MILPPTVCLDGAAVRRIREEKKLTQLYVAKVVGVTTDTISRWENNRYPTVKRENLLKLGEALEVSYLELLKQDEVGGGCPAAFNDEDMENVPARKNWLAWWIALAVLVLGVGCVFYWYASLPGNQTPNAEFFGERVLPKHAAAGVVIPVRVRLAVDTTKHGYILREHFPAGWELLEATPPATSIDNQDGTARWIIKQGQDTVMVAYMLRVDSRSPDKMLGRFRGEIIGSLEEKSQIVVVGGDTETLVAPYHWSDSDGDSRVDDSEMLEASQVFEETVGVHLDWKPLEELWDAGRYRWDGVDKRFVPIREGAKPVGKVQ